MRGDGRVFQRGPVWWIAYYRNGEEFRERGGATKSAAKKKLNQRRAEIEGGQFVGPERERVTVGELLEALVAHLEIKGAKSLVSLRSHLVPVREWWSVTKAMDLTSVRVERFQAERLAAGKAAATVNREVGALRQALHLARKQGRLLTVPYFPMLREDNARQGFFEADEFDRLVASLPEWLADFARFGYITGWRKGEIAGLRWQDVDRTGMEVQLRTSKNGEGRSLPLDSHPDLIALVEGRWAAREFRRVDGAVGLSEFVFHRDGVPLREFRKTWASACRAAGVGNKHFHDFRRTAARNMVRAGVPQTVAMSITGHKTVSMFNRYNITSHDDRREALRRTAAHVASAPRSANKVIRMEAERATG